jgi:hypothetical protein
MARMHGETAPEGETAVSAMDYPAHEKTYAGFMHMSRWFIGHITLVVLALYCFIIAGNPLLGVVLLLAAFVVLGAGIATTPRASAV